MGINKNMDEILGDIEKFKKHLYVGLKPASGQEMVKRPFSIEGIEEHPFLWCEYGDQICTISLLQEMISDVGLDVEEVWKIAEDNTIRDTEIISYKDYMANAPEDTFDTMDNAEREALLDYDDGISIVTTKLGIKGAGALINTEALRDYAQMHNTDRIIVIPYSVHEVFVIPYDDRLMKTDKIPEFIDEIFEESAAMNGQLLRGMYVLEVKERIS